MMIEGLVRLVGRIDVEAARRIAELQVTWVYKDPSSAIRIRPRPAARKLSILVTSLSIGYQWHAMIVFIMISSCPFLEKIEAR